jgi:hypothetical protein
VLRSMGVIVTLRITQVGESILLPLTLARRLSDSEVYARSLSLGDARTVQIGEADNSSLREIELGASTLFATQGFPVAERSRRMCWLHMVSLTE